MGLLADRSAFQTTVARTDRRVEDVGAQRDAVAPRLTAEHGERGVALGDTGRLTQQGIDDQPATVLHQQVAYEAEPGLFAAALAQQPRLGIGSRGMGGVAAPLAVEVALGIAADAGRRRIARVGPGPDALEAGEGLDQRAVDREVVVRQVCGWPSTAWKNLAAISSSSSRSRFLVNVQGHDRSPGCPPVTGTAAPEMWLASSDASHDRNGIWNDDLSQNIEALLATIAGIPPDHVLDLCCGPWPRAVSGCEDPAARVPPSGVIGAGTGRPSSQREIFMQPERRLGRSMVGRPREGDGETAA
jgi:hypothetical protein